MGVWSSLPIFFNTFKMEGLVCKGQNVTKLIAVTKKIFKGIRKAYFYQIKTYLYIHRQIWIKKFSSSSEAYSEKRGREIWELRNIFPPTSPSLTLSPSLFKFWGGGVTLPRKFWMRNAPPNYTPAILISWYSEFYSFCWLQGWIFKQMSRVQTWFGFLRSTERSCGSRTGERESKYSKAFVFTVTVNYAIFTKNRQI